MRAKARQLETDRRRVRKIDRITEDLEAVQRQRGTQRQGTQSNQWPLASLVGYNAGKSTLLNRLTMASVVVETSCSRRSTDDAAAAPPNNQNVLLSDTVRLCRKLPTA